MAEIKKGPISPASVKKVSPQIPDEVFKIFNQAIKDKFDGQSATVLQKDVVSALKKGGFNEREIYDKKWLDVETSYRKAGWEVIYDSPTYGDESDFESYFVFRARRRQK